MKKSILIILFVLSVTQLSVWGQTDKTGFMSIFGSQPYENTWNNLFLEEFFIGENQDYNVADVLSPTLVASFSRYSIRRFTPSKRDIYYNKMFSIMLDALRENVSSLRTPELYIKEFRSVLNDSMDVVILAKVIDVYGALLEQNPPQTSQILGYSSEHLFAIEVTGALVKTSINNEHTAAYTLGVAIPYIIQSIEKDSEIVFDQVFIKNMLLLGQVHKTSLAKKQVRDVYFKAMLVEQAYFDN